MDDNLAENARSYALRYDLVLAELLGHGIHGTVFLAEHKINKHKSAVKIHRYPEPYRREVAAYKRLSHAAITEIMGFHVPQLIRTDEDLRIIEMTIVTRPFVLDFGGAYLDIPPEFSDEVWEEWEKEKQAQFGKRWTTVRAVLAAFESLDIHIVDVNPGNIALLESDT